MIEVFRDADRPDVVEVDGVVFLLSVLDGKLR